MARKRAYKKRVDYRKGGRVKYQEGSEVFDPNTGEPKILLYKLIDKLQNI